MIISSRKKIENNIQMIISRRYAYLSSFLHGFCKNVSAAYRNAIPAKMESTMTMLKG